MNAQVIARIGVKPMFHLIHKLLKKKFRKSPGDEAAGKGRAVQTVSPDLARNKEYIRSLLGTSDDIIIHEIRLLVDNGGYIEALLVGIDGLMDESAISENVLQPLLEKPFEARADLLRQINQRLYLKKYTIMTDLHQALMDVLNASALLLVNGLPVGWNLKAEGYVVRPISEPPTEVVVKGPREGFVESIVTNATLLRRRLRHPALRFESMIIGEYTKSNIMIAYIEGIAEPELVKRLKSRLSEIKTDSILSSGEIEQMLEDSAFTIFPTIGNTERPDRAAAMMLEGRIVMFVEGDPVALIAPYLFIQSLQNQEDYSSRPYYATFVRLMRFIAFLLSVTLPSLYVMAVNFHKEIIPSELIVSLAESRQRVPFPLVMELFGLVIIFEVVREAGVRMPRAIGQAVSIVGALILGQVSVQAGFIGAPTIIIVALSTISSFMITPIADATAILRLLFIIPTSIFGFYGFLGFGLALLTHMVSLTSLGVPYMAPFAPFHLRDWKDSFVRFPFWRLRERPQSIPSLREKRIEKLPGRRKEKS
jgi:spore germination protein KA